MGIIEIINKGCQMINRKDAINLLTNTACVNILSAYSIRKAFSEIFLLNKIVFGVDFGFNRNQFLKDKSIKQKTVIAKGIV